MKNLLLFTIVCLASLSCIRTEEKVPVPATSSPLVQENDDDGGWSSSGGGEYIVTKHNPWFMGSETVSWCIDHGGEERFSQSLESAKKDIEIAIESLISQLRVAYVDFKRASDGEKDPRRTRAIEIADCSVRELQKWSSGEDLLWYHACTDTLEDNDDNEEFPESLRKRISLNYKYIENCKGADLEFILGNEKNTKAKKLLKELGVERFKKVAGYTIRTDYSAEELRGKGFIYLAADLGEYKYSGETNLSFNIKGKDTFWNNLDVLADADVPKSFLPSSGTDENLKIKDYAVSPLMSVVAHEVGHILGFQHNNSGSDLMDEDFPSSVLAAGLVYKSKFKQAAQIISNSFHEMGAVPIRIGYLPSFSKRTYDGLGTREIKENAPELYHFLHEEEELRDQYFVFDFPTQENVVSQIKKNTLNLVKLDKKTFNYNVEEKYELEFYKCAMNKEVSSTTVRYIRKRSNFKAVEFDSATESWEAKKKRKMESTITANVLTNLDRKFCGRIMVKDGVELAFELETFYFGNAEMTFLYNVGGDNKRYGVELQFNGLRESDLDALPAPLSF